ncbi:MAG: DNA mismatch repair endonuclease MutL [Clostridiaceae bacterium]|jgi:DNA mismatch repair protein MutL|nr:DNA mismatch repair endonuclease MutL [Clostridiaceae bacterium]
MGTIHKLDNQTINSIAAGEVVERPASVAKELIDNALDAGASIIRISLEAGGIKLLEVEDDGSGMSAADAALSLESHATSKLTSLDDLLRIETMGFRGEALASIAAVSRLELRSRLIASDTGSRLLVEGGKLISSESAGMKEGTTVTVRDLFFNTPARYKFLKTDRAEGSAVVDMVGRLALARPDVSFRVRRIEDKKDLLHTPGNNDLLSAIYAVFGRELAEAMVAVEHTVSPIKVSGYMTMPADARHNRSRQLFVVNQRVIQSPTLRSAADEAGKTWFMKGRFPALVLHLSIPPELVDVNVHPQKSEIRVWDEKILFRSVYHALQESLSREETIKEVKPYQQIAEDVSVKSDENISELTYRKPEELPASRSNRAQITFADSAAEARDEEYATKRVGEEDKESKQPATSEVAAKEMPSSPSDEAVRKVRASDLAGARYIGSLLETYLLFEREDSLYIIDQHAAHERILYEKLLYTFHENKEEGRLSQTLLLPVRINVNAGEMTFFAENIDEFTRLGFECEPFGETSIVIRAVPSSGSSKNELDPAAAFRAVLEAASEQSDPELAFRDTEVFHDIACKAAVKARDRLSQNEAEALLNSLLELDNPYHCPHGRPVIIRKSRNELERMFGRIV